MRSFSSSRQWMLLTAFGFGLGVVCAPRAQAGAYVQTNLVSDIPGFAALTDPALKNPWGVSETATSPFWISDQGTNESTLYSVTSAGVSQRPLIVAIPTTAAGPQGPTGQVANSTSGFKVGAQPATFIFANLNGTISAWNTAAGTTAVITATTVGAIYTGLAIDPVSTRLYAANGTQNRIDVFDGSFAPVALGATAFVDPTLPAGLTPFNVQNIGGKIYVTYSLPGRPAQISATPGAGVVAVFNTDGTFVTELITGGPLASPWGLALAPDSFGPFGGDLLVGNFSFVASEINAFNPTSGAFVGTIPIDTGTATAGGLWDLIFGNGAAGGSPNVLYFTDGINGERDGLFGSLAVPEPSGLWLLASGTVLLPALRRRRSRV